MHRELEWPVSKATCLYAHLYMVYIHLYKIIEGTSDGPKHQLPSAFAWVVGHGGCAVRRELVHSVLHKRAEKLCMAC